MGVKRKLGREDMKAATSLGLEADMPGLGPYAFLTLMCTCMTLAISTEDTNSVGVWNALQKKQRSPNIPSRVRFD